MMRRRARAPRQVFALACCLMVTAAGCGPKIPLSIGKREAALDVMYGDQGGDPPPPARPSSSGFERTTAPGFIVAPVDLDRVGEAGGGDDGNGRSSTTTTTTVASPCPVADPFEPPAAAPDQVEAGPAPGSYVYQRTGFVRSASTPDGVKAATPVSLSREIRREVKDVTTAPGPRGAVVRYRVTQTEPGVVTTTTFRIEPGVVSASGASTGGLYIEQIVTERADLPPTGPNGAPVFPAGQETFTPQPAVRIMDLPAQPQAPNPDRRSTAVDPLIGATIEVIYNTQRREWVDVCGTWVDAWRVNINFPTSYNTNQGFGTSRAFHIEGSFWIAPQLGGLIVRDSFQLGNETYQASNFEPGPRYFTQRSEAVLTSVTPG